MGGKQSANCGYVRSFPTKGCPRTMDGCAFILPCYREPYTLPVFSDKPATC